MGPTFINNSPAVKSAMQNAVTAVLHEAGGELTAEIIRSSRTDTGQTKNAYQYRIAHGAGEQKAVIGSDHINAVYEEFGTGEYALNGNGRKGGWWIKVGSGEGQISMKSARKYKWAGYRYENGAAAFGKGLRQTKKRGQLAYVFTRGKKPGRPMQKAYKQKQDAIVGMAQDIFRTKMEG